LTSFATLSLFPRMHIRPLIIAFLLLSAIRCLGTEPVVTDHSFNTWSYANVRFDVSEKWNVSALAFVRRAHGLSQWQQWYIRPSIGYALTRKVEVGVGYTYSQMFPSADPGPDESHPPLACRAAFCR